jgi:hypothetical protein
MVLSLDLHLGLFTHEVNFLRHVKKIAQNSDFVFRALFEVPISGLLGSVFLGCFQFEGIVYVRVYETNGGTLGSGKECTLFAELEFSQALLAYAIGLNDACKVFLGLGPTVILSNRRRGSTGQNVE